MGMLIDGEWRARPEVKRPSDGHFHRPKTTVRNWITVDGAPGPSGEGGFAAAPGRYHLYVSLACPWAHRTLIFRVLKGLEDMVSVSVVNPLMLEDGWTFAPGDGVVPDTVGGAEFLHQVYARSDPHYTGRASVPVLWDKETGRIVNNESSEIIRMFNSAFDAVGANGPDFYPESLRADIEAINAPIYETVNNGVYRAGFARTQAAYEEAVQALFATLDMLEERLSGQRYLAGERMTEADWRLFTTLVRFDAVYVGHFKCNIRRLVDYASLWGYTRELYQTPGVAGTVDFDHIKQHYYRSHESINPKCIVPAGPEIDFAAPHGRESPRSAAA